MNTFKLLYILLKYSISSTKRYLSLFLLIIKYKPKSILEIGVYRGIRSAEMISVAKIFNKNLSFYGFDLFKKLTKKRKNYELSKFPLSQNEINLKLSKLSNNTNLFSGNTKKTLKKFLKKKVKVDFVFIDGEHTSKQLLLDFYACRESTAKKCVFLFHDVINFSMIEAFTEVISSQEDLYGSLLFRTTSGMAIAFPKEFEGVIRPIIDVFTEPDQRLLDLKRIGQTDLNLEAKLSEKMKLQLKLWR